MSYFDLLFPFSLGMILAKYFKYNQIKEKLYSIKHMPMFYYQLSILLIMIMMMSITRSSSFYFSTLLCVSIYFSF
jgi:hypothetical protein